MPEENIKTYIIDASFMLAFLLPDEHSEAVEQIFQLYSQGKVNFLTPLILPFEVVNSLKQAIPRRINNRVAKLLIEDFLGYRFDFKEIDFEEVFTLSLTKNLSVYDASYIYLAKKYNTKLLSLDQKLTDLV